MIKLREQCLARAHKLKMGIVAMKVIGAGILGGWSGYVVPKFDKKRLKLLPGAAIRYVLSDKRINMLAIGMRLKADIDANMKTLAGNVTFTDADRTVLAEFCQTGPQERGDEEDEGGITPERIRFAGAPQAARRTVRQAGSRNSAGI